jgi:hypothetical protein
MLSGFVIVNPTDCLGHVCGRIAPRIHLHSRDLPLGLPDPCPRSMRRYFSDMVSIRYSGSCFFLGEEFWYEYLCGESQF